MILTLRKKLIGDKDFYKRMLAVMLPILFQNVITNFVSLLDNIMVGRIGTEQMSGVAIVNQLIFVFNLALFGGLAGAGIFTAQYYGKGDSEGVKNTVRAKIWIALALVIAFGIAFIVFPDELMSLFIHEGEDDIDLAKTLEFALQYIHIMLIQMPIFAVINIYASTLREEGKTRLPMIASFVAVFVNLFFNWVLIYGKFGVPALGVRGAAIATVIARITEACIIVVKSRDDFKGVYSTMKVPKELAEQIAMKGMPLLINEVLWSSGMTTLIQIMSLKGIEVISAENISNTVANLFFCAFFAMGTTVSVMIGQLLGAGKLGQAIDEDRKLIFFAVVLSTVVGIIMILIAPFVPRIYNTTELVKALAVKFLIINAIMMPFNAFSNTCYFTLRSGGKVLITFLYDSVYLWVLAIPITKLLVTYSSFDVVTIYACSYFIDIVKVILGYILVKKKSWVNNLVESDELL